MSISSSNNVVSTPPQPSTPVPAPVDPNLTDHTRALFNALHDHTGDFAMFGHQGDTSSHHSAAVDSDVLDVTGSYPAVCGFDLGRIELGWSENIDHVPFEFIRSEARRMYQLGAIITFSWHSVNPITEGGYGDNMAPESVTSVLPGGKLHEKYCGWLDHLADFLLSVRDDNDNLIPIIFRPYHEHTGDWFWWCPGSPAQPTDTEAVQFTALWRMTVEYLRDKRDVHNVLYAYSPDRSRIDMTNDTTAQAGYLYGYPDDDYVDVLGLDDYWDIDQPLTGPNATDPAERHDTFVRVLTLIGRLGAERGKLAAATEVGSPREFAAALGTNPDSPWTTFMLSAATANEFTQRVLWYLPWCNFPGAAEDSGAYGTPIADSQYADDFRRFVRDDFMRLADTLPSMYGE